MGKKCLREFGSWALKLESVANPPPNGKFLGECVSFVQQYLYNVLDIPFQAHGNAKDWAYNIPKGFVNVGTGAKLKCGDIIVYGKNFGAGYGHVGIIDCNGKFMEQNGAIPRKVTWREKPYSGYIAVLRYQGNIDLGNNPNYKIVATAGLNLREEHNIHSKKIGGIPYNTKIKINFWYYGNKYYWANVTYNGVTGYIALKKTDDSEYYAKSY